MFKGKFVDIVNKDDRFLRGPFGSALKKSLFVPKSSDTYKVYEQGVVLEKDNRIGHYYISKDYFDSKMSRFEACPGDFLVSCSGVNYGAIYRLPNDSEKGVINQALLRVRLNESLVDADYFYYYFQAYIVRAITGGTGDSTIPNFPPMEYVKNIDVELPDMNEQRRIGRLLKEIDSKIENNNKINEELFEISKQLYEHWFLQFDFPNEHRQPYKVSGGPMVWNEELHRDIPEGWEVCKFDDIVMPAPKCKSIKAPDYKKNGRYPIVDQASNLITGYTDDEQYVYDASNGSVIFGDVTTCLKFINFPFAKGTDGTKIINTYNNRIPALLMYHMLQGYKMPDVGFARHYIFLREIMLLVPPIELCQKYEDVLRAAMDKRRGNIMENKQLEDIRDFLLPLLINGQAKAID